MEIELVSDDSKGAIMRLTIAEYLRIPTWLLRNVRARIVFVQRALWGTDERGR